MVAKKTDLPNLLGSLGPHLSDPSASNWRTLEQTQRTAETQAFLSYFAFAQTTRINLLCKLCETL